MNIYNLALISALTLVVGACAGSTKVTHVYYDQDQLLNLFYYVASNRDFRVEIHGNPGSKSQADFDVSVIAAMEGSSFGPLTNFTTTPSSNSRKNYRLVMAFSGERYQGATSICREVDVASLTPVTGRIEVLAAFCYRDAAQSQLNISYAQDSSALDEAMSQVFINLFPAYDPVNMDCDDQFILKDC